MGFSKEWDKQYQDLKHLSIWPWSDMVSYVMRNCRDIIKNARVLEIGCGAGANIPFFKSLGVNYHAIEGSQAIVELLHKKYPEYKPTIKCGDFTQIIPFEEKFDLVLDRSSLTHNNTKNIIDCLGLISNKLVEGGPFIGIHWFSTQHSSYKLGEQAEDIYTRKNIKEGGFTNVGRVHFSDEAHIRELFENYFTLEILEHTLSEKHQPANPTCSASWNLLSRKKGKTK